MKTAILSSKHGQAKTVYFVYIWHGFFLALTMSMIDLNTVFPALVAELTGSKIIFGALYTVMLGAPLVFNLLLPYTSICTAYFQCGFKNPATLGSTKGRDSFSAKAQSGNLPDAVNHTLS